MVAIINESTGEKLKILYSYLFIYFWVELEESKTTTIRYLGPVWYMYLKTENCCLKTFVEICVGEKMCRNT